MTFHVSSVLKLERKLLIERASLPLVFYERLNFGVHPMGQVVVDKVGRQNSCPSSFLLATLLDTRSGASFSRPHFISVISVLAGDSNVTNVM